MKNYSLQYGLIILTVLLFSYSSSFAQTTDVRQYNVKNSFWSEVDFVQPLGKEKKFALQLDIQYRRQSEQYNQKGLAHPTSPNLGNIFLNPYQTVFRPWIQYYVKNKKIRFAISPVGYWATFGPAGANGTVAGTDAPSSHLQMYPEVRSCYQINIYDQIGRTKIQYRARFEYRWLGNASSDQSYDTDGSGLDIFHGTVNTVQKMRLRLFVRGDIALKGPTIDPKEFYMAIQDELWLGLGKNTNNSGFFDQNRAYVALGYKVSNALRIEVGYLNQITGSSTVTVGSPNVKNMDFNNVAHILFHIDNVGMLFHKKEKAEKEKQSRLNDLPGGDGSF